MKKIINGRAYDTSTAKSLSSYKHSYPGRYDWFEETLCQKRTGEYFIYGTGGAASRYAQPAYGGNYTGGERITPLTYEEARQWAEDNLDADEYLEIFGEPEIEESGEKVRRNISIDSGLAEWADKEAARQGRGFSAFLEDLIRKEVNK